MVSGILVSKSLKKFVKYVTNNVVALLKDYHSEQPGERPMAPKSCAITPLDFFFWCATAVHGR